MLMQNFKSAADLGITGPQLGALQKTLVLLDTEALEFAPIYDKDIGADPGTSFDGKFNMAVINVKTDCGTVRCISGTAEMLGGDVQFRDNWNIGIDNLFRPRLGPKRSLSPEKWRTITTAQAATALRSYGRRERI